MRAAPLFLLLLACNGNKQSDAAPKLVDTGWFSTPTDPLSCTDRFLTTSPEEGFGNWYWRDRPVAYTETNNAVAYDAYLVDEGGLRLDTTMQWDTTGLSFQLEWDGWMQADTDYTLVLTDCTGITEVGFRTSSYGRPLDVDPGSLVGNSYLLDLEGAVWVEPPQLSGLIALYLTTPILLGVALANDSQIDVIGATGITDSFGFVVQSSSPTWDFPLADFTDRPYLDLQVDEIVLQYEISGGEVLDIPVHNFVYQATLTADGTAIGGGVLSGLGDTRNLGAVLGDDDNLGALCAIAAGLNVPCEPCADGLPYCLTLRAEGLSGVLVPDLNLLAIE